MEIIKHPIQTEKAVRLMESDNKLTLIVEELYGSIYYRISWLGVLIGAGYGFVSGFILAFIFSLIYNLFIRD